MNKFLIKLLFMWLAALCFSGCLYANVQRPLDSNFNKTEIGTKEGRSTSRSALWLFSWGDAGTRTAAINGDIQVINYADSQFVVFLFGLYTRVTTVVYGD